MPGISSTCACEWDRDFQVDEYLKHCEQIKILADDLLGTCDEIENTKESPQINLSDAIIYWLIGVVVLDIAYLLLLVVTILCFFLQR